jgi:hypothetical protein
LLITSAYAGVAGTSGYETYKAAIKNTAAAKSMTNTIALSIQDNGKPIVNVNATVKKDKAVDTVSANVNIQGGGSDQSVDVFTAADGKKVIKASTSDVYTIMNSHETRGNEKLKEKADLEQGDQFQKEAENLIDALVGNLKDYVIASDAADGKKEIHLSLSGSQLPTAVNAIGSFLVKKASHDSINERDTDATSNKAMMGMDFNGIKREMPKLMQDVSITNVDLLATVDDSNTITNQKATIAISGKDASGLSHAVTVSMDLGISGLNSTSPDTIDLTGKQVQTVEPKHWDGSKSNR